MQVFCDNYVENQALYHTFTEPLFLKPDGVRTRYPIGWNGYGRYLTNTLKVTYNGLPCNISEESNGIWFNFDIAPGANTNYEDYTVKYVTRPLDYAFSVGLSEGGYPDEEYFLFPNWNNALGEGDGFWIGKWEASNNGANIPKSKSGANLWNANFTDSKKYANLKGERFGIVRNRQWVSIALWTDHHNIHVKGNNTGNSNNLDGEGTTAEQCGGGYNNNYFIISGKTVPNSWNHNNKSNGIKNLVGNQWEWVDGLENRYGKIYIYDEDNETYIDSGISNLGEGSIASIYNSSPQILNEGIATTAVLSDDIRYIPSNLDNDNMYFQSNGIYYLFRGGCPDNGTGAGLWAFDTMLGSGFTAWHLSFRLIRELD